MTNTLKKFKHRITASFLLMLTLSSVMFVIPLISNDSENYTNNKVGNDRNDFILPALSSIGEDPWWNETFLFRRVINITNPKAEDLNDYIVSTEFNYTQMVNEYKMNSTLKDVRVVENGILREYFVQKDYPVVDFATVWFETNCSAGESEYDTYLYYGNADVEHDTNYYNKDNRFGLAWYRYDEGSGNAEDSAGNYADGTLTNMEAGDWAPGKMGEYSLKFDGSNEYVSLPSINPTSAITVSAWVKSSFADYYKGYWQLISKYNAYILGTWGQNNRMAFLIHNGGWQYTSEMYVPSGECDEWHLFIGTYDSSLAKKNLYYDGVFQDDQDVSGSITADTGPIHIARREGGSPVYFDGWIDDVRFYDYALTQDEIEGLYNYSSVSAVVQGELSQNSDVLITAYDVDGRIVPNALVSLVNYTTGQLILEKSTAMNGSVFFPDLESGPYNITVNYTLSSGEEIVVYNSSANNDIYNFTKLYDSRNIELNLWTIDFDIVDWDKNPLNYAYINISLTPGGDVLETLRLNDGKAVFRWKNETQYYYKIYYDNEDYSTIPVPLNESYIFRNDYVQNEKLYNRIINVNETNILTGTEYQVQEDIFTNGSSQLGRKLLLKANISLTGMTDFLDTVKIYYLDKNGEFTEESLIYFNDTYSGDQEDFIEINIRDPPKESSNLIDDDYEAYGLRIDVRGFNTTTQTPCDGIIQVETVETCYVYNKTSLAKLQIRVLDQKVGIIPVQSVIVRVNNSAGNTITNLITDSDGYAHGQINSQSELWYLRVPSTENYTFILNFYGNDKFFKVNVSDQWKPSGLIDNYNYTLDHNSTLVLKIQIDISDYLSNFTNLVGDSVVNWGETMTFSVNYTVKAGPAANWEGLNDPDELTVAIGNYKSFAMSKGIGDGNFTLTINSNVISAGDSSETYWVEIRGRKIGYINPEQLYFTITINSIPTGISFHNYSSMPNEFLINEVSQYYNELINVTFKYYINTTKSFLIAETFTYEWDYGSGSVSLDPINPGYYTLEIDTSDAPNIGKYRIEITASLENHTKIESYGIYLNILSRPTTVNGSSGLLYVSESLYIFEQHNFTFSYRDTMSTNPISNLDEKSYILQKLDANRDPIPGTEETGSLSESITNNYILDLDTESRDDGEYSIIITLNKDNYDQNVVIISLIIKKREFHFDWPTAFSASKIEIASGGILQFTLNITDVYDSAPIIGAKVYLTIRNKYYNFTDNNDGTYEVSTSTIAEAFFAPETITATLTIEKQYFSVKTVSITIVVNMHQTFGIPTFYLLMIVGAVIAVVASLTIYRTVQQARIPNFVKKARKMKKEIKGKKSISNSLLYPSKEEFLVKQLGDKWELLGLSLQKILGTEDNKKKKLPETTQEAKFKGGGV